MKRFSLHQYDFLESQQFILAQLVLSSLPNDLPLHSILRRGVASPSIA